MTDSIEEDLDLVLDDDWDFEPGEDIGCPHPSVLLRMLCRPFVSPLENPLEKTAYP